MFNYVQIFNYIDFWNKSSAFTTSINNFDQTGLLVSFLSILMFLLAVMSFFFQTDILFGIVFIVTFWIVVSDLLLFSDGIFRFRIHFCLDVMSFFSNLIFSLVYQWIVQCPIAKHINNNKIGICCFSYKHAALMSKNKKWFIRNHDNVFEWSSMCTCGRLG
jgi:hypothetical protein